MPKRAAAYVLPMVTNDQGQMVVLLGRERHHRKWCGFGGGLERGETPVEAASREAFEESLGYLGKPTVIKPLLTRWGYIPDSDHTYFSLPLERYDPHLPQYYRQTYDFISSCGRKKLEKHCSEKIEIAWVRWTDLKHAIMNGERNMDNNMVLDRFFFAEMDQLLRAAI